MVSSLFVTDGSVHGSCFYIKTSIQGSLIIDVQPSLQILTFSLVNLFHNFPVCLQQISEIQNLMDPEIQRFAFYKL